ncbi:type I toxin-antitoxin system SymE family toxin [Niastella caeni]|uniref:Type I toxin-antitoxin system SymE family toxin n=1 Tax=Niastella caeni TaxID=2569763 RepID=A0A4S8I269_9BACT|nr:type I toxin-antitoxin system SymE family toxin [Niastella caeni]THU41871.1 type I toxin-antitoxin system SymE family toxin [Niastella caeni]
MEIKSEFHATQKTLFRRVNQIRKVNGTCDFEQEGTGYRLNYCESGDLDNMYIVQHGKDGLPFRLHDGLEGSFFHLNKGEVLVYKCESGNKVWFSYPKWLERFGETDLDLDLGYTDYGSLSEMIQAGLVIDARHADRPLFVTASGEMKEKPLAEVVPKQAVTEETQPEIQPESVDEEPGIFKLLTRLINNSDLQTALEKARWIRDYCSKQTESYIKIYQVAFRPGACVKDKPAQLRFGGRWMERAGFIYGQSIQVVSIKNVILIVPIHPHKLDK